VGDRYAGTVSVDLHLLHRVLEIDRGSRTALIQGGIFGPNLEEQLKPHGLTLRHFPQSFEMSTLGGWIATRSGGHYATLFTHIDDFVEGVRAITPKGVYETRRLPGSGAGPDPARLLMETVETAITWDRFSEFHAGVVAATEAAVQRVCGRGIVSCRFAYVYPDGPAPYYTVLGQGRPGAEREQWAEIKAAASDALIA